VQPSLNDGSQTLDSTQFSSQLHDSVVPRAIDENMTPRSSTQFSAQDPTEFASIPRSPSSLTLSLFQPAFAMPGRIFTDIFCGFGSPLASAILARGGQVFRVDILLDKFMDIFNDDFYEQLLRFSACG